MVYFPFSSLSEHRVAVWFAAREICDAHGHTEPNPCDDVEDFTFDAKKHTLGDYTGGMLERVLDYIQVGYCSNYDKEKGGQLAKRYKVIVEVLRAEDAKMALEKEVAVQDTE
ncbi:hypothetical protein H4S07_002250 [Coemansia furcata]|uniref:Uncharacterized protein n=1 Tax=Coemansia furcata TaxID=417177 RepID=A0ACC1LL99_9FUNG|nr:hypothetical protein H4S07_002250 [Coemansia furcata]